MRFHFLYIALIHLICGSAKLVLPRTWSGVRLERQLVTERFTMQSRPDVSYKSIAIRGGSISANHISKVSLHQSKFTLQVGLTVFNILCWALPLRSRYFSENKSMLSFSNAFAGGIFMMLSFGHLLPEAVTTMAQIVPNGANKALVFCLVGYMAMLFIEKVAFSVHEVNEELPASFDSTGKIANVLTAPQSALVAHNIESSNRQKSAIALCCAISVHSFFEAAALGLATDFTSACMMSACIALHQPAESVALLVAFLKSDLTPRQIACWLTAYSLMSVVGVLAGLMMTTWANRQMEAMVMAITAGTFIYVGATEIANEEFQATERGQVRLLRYLCYAGGMLVMHGIAAISAHYE